MMTCDYDYGAGERRYYEGDIISIKGDPDKNEADALGIVAYSGDDGSFAIITADGYIGFGERVVTEPTGKRFDLSPLYDRLRAGGFKEQPGGQFKVGDIALQALDDFAPGVVFHVFNNGDAAMLLPDGMSLGTPPQYLRATGETFDLSPMFNKIRG
jgi:hypothetical protein